jgi:exopolyphosphatase/guanosine-5'-triphosphate,3'-diphosphate pyrophosphatase
VLWDLLGRSSDRDPRIASTRSLAARYAVDKAQAERVESTALQLFDQADAYWKFAPGEREWLVWAARVHEIGLAIAHSQHHVHSGYILRNADLAGFTRQEQELLAAIVQNHRRKPDTRLIRKLPMRYRRLARRMTALLRLAVLLRRARREQKLPALRLVASKNRLELHLPAAWLKRNPLSATDLDRERLFLSELGIGLVLHVDDT